MLKEIVSLERNSQTRRDRRRYARDSSYADGFVLQPSFATVRVEHVSAPARRCDAGLVEIDAGFLFDFSTSCGKEGFALLNPTTGQLPYAPKVRSAQVSGMKQQHAALCIQENEAHCVAFDKGL
nr:hypothetical protein [Steroidobacter cummioxidans]